MTTAAHPSSDAWYRSVEKTSETDDERIKEITEVSHPALLRKRAQHDELFTALSGEHIQSALRVGGNDRIKAAAGFVVGGVRQAITGWLAGDVALSAHELVDLLVTILDGLNEPRLFGSLTG